MAGHELASWKKELAAQRMADKGCALGAAERWAQRQAKENSEVWRRFVAGKGAAEARMQLVGAGPAPVVLPPEPMDPDQPEAIYMERAHWAMWQAAHLSWKRAEAERDELGAIQYSAMTVKLREAWQKAKAAREEWEISNRKVVPLQEIEAVLQKFAVPLRALLENFENELATMVNPDDPGFARRQIAEWKVERLYPPIAELIENLEKAV